MELAKVVSQRATCPRASVGAVIVLDNRVMTTGYNGSPRGVEHCTDVGCDIRVIDGVEHCNRATHAELNAVAQAARHGISIQGSTLYLYDSLLRGHSCEDCIKAAVAAGVEVWVTSTPDKETQ
ncbi:MAG TPA: deoxycytidylate deaminase [Candidatus Tripitaka californicus]|uniref:deoxycytidylate deaminase n=1 Tax=Candidatus Tripitaka californicus TaxID=3367616 RepID=UPI0040275E45